MDHQLAVIFTKKLGNWLNKLKSSLDLAFMLIILSFTKLPTYDAMNDSSIANDK